MIINVKVVYLFELVFVVFKFFKKSIKFFDIIFCLVIVF